jgi:hypothetical protein
VQRAYVASTRMLSVLLMLLGAAMIAGALVRGGGALALGVVLGVAFLALGAARLWLSRGVAGASPDAPGRGRRSR